MIHFSSIGLTKPMLIYIVFPFLTVNMGIVIPILRKTMRFGNWWSESNLQMWKCPSKKRTDLLAEAQRQTGIFKNIRFLLDFPYLTKKAEILIAIPDRLW